MSESDPEVTSDEVVPPDGGLRMVYALVELRRTALHLVDMRGKIAEDLLAAYDTVSFDGPSLGMSNRITVTRDGTGRSGAIDARQATYVDSDPRDPDDFASEAPVFLRRAERHVSVREYERTGIRYRFEAAALGSPNGLATLLADHLRHPDWNVGSVDCRFETQLDGWTVWLFTSPVLEGQTPEPPYSQQYAGRMIIDVDQFRFAVPASEAIHLDLGAALSRARSMATTFLDRLGASS